MSKSVVFLCLLVVAFAAPSMFSPAQYKQMWQKWSSQQNKVYASPTEATRRFHIFCDNVDMITAHNSRQLSYKLAINDFADLTWEEFKASHLSFHPTLSTQTAAFTGKPVPKRKDWREEGAVGPVHDQGQCGSCWAWSAVGCLEGFWAAHHGQLYNFSAQELVDCATDSSKGCQGGLMTDAFDYMIKAGGLCTAEDYPYEGRDEDCKADQCTHYGPIKAYKNVKESEDALVEACDFTPVSVAIDVEDSFQFYSSGIYAGPCGTELNHGVLLVGYDTEGSKDFWIVKNSWSESWGEEGYIRMIRNTKATKKSGICGICTMASYITE